MATSLLHLRSIIDPSQTDLNTLISKTVSVLKHLDALDQAKTIKQFALETLGRSPKSSLFSSFDSYEDQLSISKTFFMDDAVKALKKDISNRTTLLLKKKHYKDYFTTKKLINENNEKLSKLTAGMSSLNKEIAEIQLQIDQSKWKTRRITNDEVSDLESKVKKLDLAIAATEDIHKLGYLNQPEYVNLVTNLFKDLKQDVPRLSQIKADTEKIQDLLTKILKMEKKLDEYFARIFAYVYIYQDGETNSTKMCFTHKELSIYLFYMSVSQIIMSKTRFMEVFLDNIQTQSQSQVVTSLFNDYLNSEYMKNQFESTDRGLHKDSKETAKTFSLILNSQLSLIFEKQQDSPNTSWFGKVLQYLNISKSFVFEVARDTVFGMYMTNVSIALLALLTLSTGSLFFVTLTTVFLCYLGNMILDSLSNHTQKLASDSKHQFLGMLANVYNKIYKSEDFSLDFEGDLEPITVGDGRSMFQNVRHPVDKQIELFSTIFDSFHRSGTHGFEMHWMKRRRLI